MSDSLFEKIVQKCEEHENIMNLMMTVLLWKSKPKNF